MFVANGDEDIIQLHNNTLNEGLYIGITAPGPTRYFMVYPHWPSGIACGYNMSNADFNMFLKKGDCFTTDKTLMMVYSGAQDDQVVRNQFREMIRYELPQTVDNGEPMYCTWLPFLKNINEELLLDMAERAAKMGFKYFVVDDGWFVEGNWAVDTDKFPNGLEVISEKVKALGMKFGLWFNIGTDYGVLGSAPEDNAINYHGKVKTFGSSDTVMTRCLASVHRDKAIEKLIQLTKQYGVDYFKLDFSSIVSPYGIIPLGCHATNHAYHNDFSDSVFAQYQALNFLKDSLKKKFSDLIIDFSFETYGTDSPSIGALISSELQHITNCNTMHPELLDAFRIRQTVYNYSSLLPIERILGSLINIEGEHAVEHFMTPFTGAPLAAGDLRNVSPEDSEKISKIATEWEQLNSDTQLKEFYKVRGKLELTHNDWDGFARFNSLGNGMLFIFQNKFDSSSISLQLEFPKKELKFYDAISKEYLGTYSEKQLKSGVTLDLFTNTNCRSIIFS
jgi:alpha-galactosidase